MHKSIILGSLIIALVFIFSTRGGLTATPKFWHDEAVPFEIARNIAEYGKADLAIAPNIFWEKSYMTHATGFPLTFPLAGVFKIFGVGVTQSRLFMIAWMCAALATLFFVMRAFFDKKTAFFSVLLVATFSSFYANGRTSTGEIPGFLFLLFALYFLYQKEWYGWGGFFAALAAITKPSMYLLVLPTIVLEFLVYAIKEKLGVFAGFERGAGMVRPSVSEEESEARNPEPASLGRARKAKISSFSLMPSFGFFVKQNVKIFKIAQHLVKNIFSESMLSTIIGALPVLLFWIWLINPAPFSLASWQEMIAFYQNAFNAPSLLSQFPTVIPKLLTHSTIMHFGVLLAIIIFAWQRNFFNAIQNRLVIFLFFYGAASFFYFLRSPGWFRYLLGTELLILAALPAALQKEELWRNMLSIFTGLRARAGMVSRRNVGTSEGDPLSTHAGRARKVKMLSMFLLLGIAGLQSLQYLLGAEIPYGTKSIEIAQFINKEILAHNPSATIGIVDDAPIAALISAGRKYQRVAVGGYNTFVGTHPLSLPPEQLPAYFISANPKKNEGYQDILQTFYQLYRYAPYDALIYKKN